MVNPEKRESEPSEVDKLLEMLKKLADEGQLPPVERVIEAFDKMGKEGEKESGAVPLVDWKKLWEEHEEAEKFRTRLKPEI